MKRNNNFKLWFDRLLSKSLWRQFGILFCILVVVFLLSWFFLNLSGCSWGLFCEDNNIGEWLLPLYLLIDSNALNNLYIKSVNGWALFVSSIIYVIGMFVFNGMIISIMTNAIERRVTNHNEGHIHYLKSGHYIIMGYDDMVPSIISDIFRKDNEAYVLMLTSAEVTVIRKKLMKSFTEERMKHIIINYGHRVSAEAYRDIRLESSKHVYIVGNRSKSTHDAINVECVDSICDYLQQPGISDCPKRIICVFEDLDTYSAFKTSEIFGRVRKLGIEFVPYNYYSGWAKQVFIKREYKDQNDPTASAYQYPSVYGNGMTSEDKKYVHLVFVGTTNFAVAFAMEAAHVLHFPNFINNKKLRTRITFIDRNADKEKDEFIVRNRHFFEVQSYIYRDLTSDNSKTNAVDTRALYFGRKGNYGDGEKYKKGIDYDFLDVEFQFIKGDVFSESVQAEIGQWACEHNKKQYLSIFLALSNQRENFVMGMNMPDMVYGNDVPIFIRQDRSDNFVTNLREADKDIKNDPKKNVYSVVKGRKLVEEKGKPGRYANIYPFGMNETAYSADEKSLQRAKLINYLYCTMSSDHKFQSLFVLNSMSDEQIWTEANEHWKGLSVADKWSNLYNAYTIRIKLDTLHAMRGHTCDIDSLSDDEAEIMAEIEHNRWNVEKLLMGFRKPHYNEDKYEHPDHAKLLTRNKKRFIHHDIRPFDKLNDIDNLDKEFSRYIPWIMDMTEKG